MMVEMMTRWLDDPDEIVINHYMSDPILTV